MKWLLIIAAIVLIAYLLLFRRMKPLRYRGQTAANFPRFIESLMSQGGDGALLFIYHEDSNRFVQFAKYLAPRRNICFAFPDASWSRPYYSAVATALAETGFQTYEQSTGETTTPRFLRVDDIWTVQSGAEIAATAFQAMGVAANATYTIYQEGPASFSEWKRYEANRSKSLTNR